MKLLFLCIVLLSFSVLTFAQNKDEVSYSKDLYPIIKVKCLKCHEKDDENPSSFAMDSYNLMRTSGNVKNIIIPGDGANSFLIMKLLPNPPKGAQMPIFSKKKLPQEEVDLFKRWIDQGAKDN